MILGAAGTLVRVSPIRCVGLSSKQTTGCSSSVGCVYSSTTSSMRATKSPSTLGMHHILCCHGLSCFSCKRRRIVSSQSVHDGSAAPSHRPIARSSSAPVPSEDPSKQWPPAAIPLCLIACVLLPVVAIPQALAQVPTPRNHVWCETPWRSPTSTVRALSSCVSP